MTPPIRCCTAIFSCLSQSVAERCCGVQIRTSRSTHTALTKAWSGSEDQFRTKLQAAPSNAVGNCIAGKSIATVPVERKTTELVDAVYRVGCVVYILDRYPEPLMIQEV